MATAGKGALAPSSSGYGGGGVGGKFDKRPIRRNRPNPYDRPPTALRNPSLVSKLLVDPAKKLIASSANVFFSYVFRKNLPLPPSLPVSNPESSDRIQAPVLHDDGPLAGVDCHNSRGEDKSGVLELELLLKQKSFTRSEIDRLTGLLRSKAVDLPVEKNVNNPVTSLLKPVTNLQNHQEYRESPLEGKGLKVEKSHGLVSTPVISSRVLDAEIASPTELAKEYMDRLPSKFSPSTMSSYSQSTRKDRALLSNSPFTPAAGQIELGKNGVTVTTPSSRGRSGIYMSHTPYSRVYQSTAGKVGGSSGYMFGSKKRGNSELDDLGYVGPMRKIRQRNGLVYDKVAISSRGIDVSKEVQKSSFMNNWKEKAVNGPSTSSHVHPRSSEVAARILQQLENISPKEKSAESKHNVSGERSSSKMFKSVQDHQKLDTTANREFAAVQEGTTSGLLKENEKQNGPRKSYFQDAKASAKCVFTGTVTSDSATTSVAQRTPTFSSMINAHEGSRVVDTWHNGPASEGRDEFRISATSQQLDSAKSTIDKKLDVVGKTMKTTREPVFNKTCNLSDFTALPSSTTEVDAVNLSPTVSVSEKPKEVEKISSLALDTEAPDTKPGFLIQPKSLSSFSFGDGSGPSPQVHVSLSSKDDDIITTQNDAKSIEKPKSVHFGTFGSSVSNSSPSFSFSEISKLNNNGTASISSSLPLISTGLTNSVANNFASSASTSSDKTRVTENKNEKEAYNISPPFQFGSSTSSPIHGSSGIAAPFTFSSSSSSASNLFASGQAHGLSSTTNPSSVSSMVSSTISVTPVTFNFGASSSSSFTSNLTNSMSTSTTDNSAVPSTSNPSLFTWQNPNSLSGSSSAPVFSFTATSASPPSVFGNQCSSTFQMNRDDSMAEEDTLQQSSNPIVPIFDGQPLATAASPSGFTFSSTVQSSPSPFQFGGQPSQNVSQNPPFQFSGQPSQGGALQNSMPFQGTGSLEFNGGGGGGGGSFVFGSGGVVSSGRKIVKVNRNKHRKK